MGSKNKTIITVQTTIHAPVQEVWKYWTNPEHIICWNQASDDWYSPSAVNDLQECGKFSYRMEARDGSEGFDFCGEYTRIKTFEFIGITLGDDRKVELRFLAEGNTTRIIETFDPEETNPVELQRYGWQSILDNFRKYVEATGRKAMLHFEISIHAGATKVYDIMLDKKHYTTWTAEFNPTSRFEGSWKKGSKMLFIGTDKDGNIGGMVSRIKENIPNQFLSIEHLGLINNGIEITSGAEVQEWAGALENYTFTETNGTTLLSVDLDSIEEHKGYFEETWPRALNVLKAICEE